MPYPGSTTFPGGVFPGSIAIDVTPAPSGAPCPNMGIELVGLSGVSLSVWRSAAGRRTQVRGFSRRELVGDSYALRDFECPFGIDVSYDVECFDAGGVLLDTVSTGAPAALGVTVPWISDALSPSLSVPVVIGGASLTERTLRRDGGIVAVNGATEPVGQGGVRRAGAGIPLTFHCKDESEEQSVLSVLNSADPLVLRTPTGYRQLPRLAYVTTSEWVVEIPPSGGGSDAFSRIRGVVDIVAAPAASVVVPVRTYGDVHAAHADYQAVRTDNADYLAVLRG